MLCLLIYVLQPFLAHQSLRIPPSRTYARVDHQLPVQPQLDSSLYSNQLFPPTHPWRCLCFGFSEQIIYTCPFPFFPPFLLTDCMELAFALFPPNTSLHPPQKTLTYLTPLAKLLH